MRDIERFESKVDKSGGPDACWEWVGARDRDGYGQFGSTPRGRLAHRISWERSNGPIPSGMCVCHTCDCTSCVNPAHMFLGTHTENMRDCSKKGRFNDRRGQKNAKAKLDEVDVLFIRYWLKRGHTQKEISKAFGVWPSTIGDINTGRKWSHLETT